MPTYEYACRACGQHLEVVQSFKDDSLTDCSACDREGTLRKVFSAAGIIFKGSGWHIKDYSSAKDAAAGATDAGPSSGDSGSGTADSGKSDAKGSGTSGSATSGSATSGSGTSGSGTSGSKPSKSSGSSTGSSEAKSA